MRTFIALPLPRETLDTLQEIQGTLRRLGSDVRWSPITSIHLTLKFLGEIEESLLSPLVKELQEATRPHQRIRLRVGGLGAFPDIRSPRIIWCGVGGEIDKLADLHKDIEEACARLGFQPEKRAFRPHLTLGRVRGKRGLKQLTDCIRIGSNLESHFEAHQLNVFRSTLTPKGAVYAVLAEIALPGLAVRP